MRAKADAALCGRILQADEENFAFFAERAELPGVVIFRTAAEPSPEFDVALIGNVDPAEAGRTLDAIGRVYRERGRRPRIRLSPLSRPDNWPLRLRRAGFIETGESPEYFSVPPEARLSPRAAVRVTRATTPEHAERFAEIQVAGFGLPPGDLARERELTHRHLAAGDFAFYLASLDGEVVAAARSCRREDGLCALAALATLPEARGRGVATSLLARMVADARAGGGGTIFGTTLPGSYAAGLYRRLGFVTEFRTRTFVLDDPGAHGAERD